MAVLTRNYSEQGVRARRAAGLCFAVEGLTGALPVETALKVYKARVDPHLIAGADVSPDSVGSYLEELEREQIAYLRRMLGLGSRSMVVPLYSETGIWPIRYRRADLAVRYLEYAMSRDPDTLVWRASQDSMALADLGCTSWYADLQTAVRACGGLLGRGGDISLASTADCRSAIRTEMARMIHAQYQDSTKLHVLAGPINGNRVGHAGGSAMSLRTYLEVDRKKHRIALTRWLLSNHCLAIELLRHKERYYEPVPEWARKCRFCASEVEDEMHAAFVCVRNEELVRARQHCRQSLATMTQSGPCIDAWDCADYAAVVADMLGRKRTASMLARLIHDVLGVYDASPILRMEIEDREPS